MNQPLPPMPSRIAKLPKDHRGFPIPWFVAVVPQTGERDFRVADARKRSLSFRFRKCWVCGEQMGKYLAFVIGPMCVVNRITSEPGCHLDCAEWSAKACPFLSRPRMKRNENDLPEGHQMPAGIFLKRNPGATAIYITKTFSLFKAQQGEQGYLVKLGEPTEVRWFAESKPATFDQVRESIDSGYPLLLAEARKDGAEAVKELQRHFQAAVALMPDRAGLIGA